MPLSGIVKVGEFNIRSRNTKFLKILLFCKRCRNDLCRNNIRKLLCNISFYKLYDIILYAIICAIQITKALGRLLKIKESKSKISIIRLFKTIID